MELTHGHLLGGRIRYAQPAQGFRSGIEPVLLAASVPVRPGQRVLEAGTGAGAALLCLAARVEGISGLGLERDPRLAALAEFNLQENGFRSVRAEPADITDWQATELFDHVFSNPPWHDPVGTSSPQPAREQAKRAAAGLAETWIRSLARALKSRGTLTLILPAAPLVEWMVALATSGCGSLSLLPLWPRPERAAKLLLLRAIKGGSGPMRVLAGLTLHAGTGYTPQTDAILRGGAPLSF